MYTKIGLLFSSIQRCNILFHQCKANIQISASLSRRRTWTAGPEMSCVTNDKSVIFDDVKNASHNDISKSVRTMDGYTHKIDETARSIMTAKDRQLFKMSKRIYYRDKKETPLLTWSMIEQIRYLYALDPQIWTADKISQNFPVSAEKALLVAKGKWRPRTEEERFSYDTQIIESWKKIGKNKLGDPALLAAFIQKRSMEVHKSLANINPPNNEMNLRFEGEKEIYVPQEKEFKNKTYKINKRRRPGFSFSDVITTYEDKVNGRLLICDTEQQTQNKVSKNNDKRNEYVDFRRNNKSKPLTYDNFVKRNKSKVLK